MRLKRLFLTILYIGIACQLAIPTLAEEQAALPETPAEPISEPAEELSAAIASSSAEILDTLIATSTAPLSLDALSEEPELEWGCVTVIQHDPETGEETEAELCGMGYWRTICYDTGNEEICDTFFELNEEEPSVDYLAESIQELQTFESFDLSLSLNGTPLQPQTPVRGGTGTLAWSFNVNETRPELPHTYRGTFGEMLGASSLYLHIFKGSLGSATLLESIPLSSMFGTSQVSISEPGEYFITISAHFTPGQEVPGYACGGELCPVFRAYRDSFVWFAEHGATYLNDAEDPEDALAIYYEDGLELRHLGSRDPLAFGIQSFSVGEESGVSSVLFLPGIKGSRLYRPSDTCDPLLSLSCPGVKLWEPSGEVLLPDLFLGPEGTGGRSDIYVKEGEILAEVLGNHFYSSFVNQMNALVADGALPAWKAVAYDWRLSLDAIVANGVKRDDRIYFSEPSENPYIESTLRDLAAASPTGKVSVVAHSNGGLVAKRLMQKLESEGATDLVDKIILVGVPQSGAPQAMAALLYGYGEALPLDRCGVKPVLSLLCSSLASRASAREMAARSPMAHHLLPSARYFADVPDVDHPVARFVGTSAYAEERAWYGNTIDGTDELYHFLTAADGGRVMPNKEDITNASILSWDFLQYAKDIHESIDTWVPPSGVRVYQIAGWGMDTVSGVEFYEQPKLLGGYKEMYKPVFVEDGDGVVPIPSALMLGSNAREIQSYWLDLGRYSADTDLDRNHGNMFEVDDLRVLIRDILFEQETSSSGYISTVTPEALGKEKLIYFLHSPLSLELYDAEGRHVGETDSGDFESEIPGAKYGEFGDVKYIIASADSHQVRLNGKGSGTFTLDVQRLSGSNVTSFISFTEVPTTKNTIVTMQVAEDLEASGNLRVDYDGDGSVDSELVPVLNATTLFEEDYREDESGEPSRSESSKKIESAITASAYTSALSLPKVIASTSEETNTAAQDKNSSEDAELTASEAMLQTQPLPTTSADTEVNAGIVKWLSVVLYNLWQGIVKLITLLFT